MIYRDFLVKRARQALLLSPLLWTALFATDVQAVVGGVLATDFFYEAVFCGPRAGGAATMRTGWESPVLRCEINGTLITPNLMLTERSRIFGQDGRFEWGHISARVPVPLESSVSATGFEWGSGLRPLADGPTVHRYGVMCFEQRLSGIKACCPHPWIDEDPSANERPRFYRPASRSQWNDPFPPRHQPGDPMSFLGVSAGGTFATYQAYVDRCADPLAANDAPVGPHAFFLLSQRVEESDITPIPLALTFPDGTTDAAFFESSPRPMGDIVGYGDRERWGDNSERYVATGATALRRSPTPPDSADVHSIVNRLRLANGTNVEVDVYQLGDGRSNGGAGHVDFAAPWLFTSGGQRRVYAVAFGNVMGFGDILYSAVLTDQSAPHLREFLDPDGDGLHRGFVDAQLPDGSARPGYVDRDFDGLSEYREIAGDPAVDNCIDANPPVAGRCWTATGGDNCSPPASEPIRPELVIAYQNYDQRDRDGDGTGDVCDLCPDMWDRQASCRALRDLAAGESPSGRPVGEGEPMGVACALRLAPTDVDGDGVSDTLCDNCAPPAGTSALGARPYSNPLQEDRDRDGIGDACDLCPDEADDGADADGDGIGDACDNCAGEVNRDQANCNLEAERAAGVEPRGDACDPTPCPRFHPVSVVRPAGPATFVLETSALYGRGFAGAAGQGTAPTGFRYCLCEVREDTPAAREICARPTSMGGGGCEIGSDPYGPPSAWQSPSVAFPFELELMGPGVSTEAVVRYARPPDSIPFQARWSFESDISAPSHPLYARAGVVIWAHAREYELRRVPDPRSSMGVRADPFGCPASATCPPVDERLSSYYWSGELERLSGLRRPVPSNLPLFSARALGRICTACVSAFPLPALQRDCENGGLCFRLGTPPAAFEGYDYLDLRALVGPLDELLEGRIEPELLASLVDSDLLWIVAAEPVEEMAASTVHFAGVDGESGLVEMVARISEGTLTREDTAVQAIPLTEGGRYLLAGRQGLLVSLAPGPIARAHDLVSGEEAEVELSSPLGWVGAATVGSASGLELLVVDTLEESDRLLRVDLSTGQLEVLQQFPSRGLRHDLARFADGSFAIAGWSSQADSYVVVRFTVDGEGVRELGRIERTGVPLGGLQASALGVTLLVGDEEVGWRPEGVLLEAFGKVAAGDLASAF